MINLIKETRSTLTAKQQEIITKLTERLKDCDQEFTPQEIEKAYLESDHLDIFLETLSDLIFFDYNLYDDLYNLFYGNGYKWLGSDYMESKQ